MENLGLTQETTVNCLKSSCFWEALDENAQERLLRLVKKIDHGAIFTKEADRHISQLQMGIPEHLLAYPSVIQAKTVFSILIEHRTWWNDDCMRLLQEKLYYLLCSAALGKEPSEEPIGSQELFQKQTFPPMTKEEAIEETMRRR